MSDVGIVVSFPDGIKPTTIRAPAFDSSAVKPLFVYLVNNVPSFLFLINWPAKTKNFQ